MSRARSTTDRSTTDRRTSVGHANAPVSPTGPRASSFAPDAVSIERTRALALAAIEARGLELLELPEAARDARPEAGEILIFSSNWNPAQRRGGFHGAGSAALAMRGTWDGHWRQDQAFLAEKSAFETRRTPRDGPHYARFGVGLGLQRGRRGLSYAVATVTRPGARLSYPLSEAERLDDIQRGLRPDTHTLSIEGQLRTLVGHMRAHPEFTFICTPIGEGFAGLTRAETRLAWTLACDGLGLPGNLVLVTAPGHIAR